MRTSLCSSGCNSHRPHVSASGRAQLHGVRHTATCAPHASQRTHRRQGFLHMTHAAKEDGEEAARLRGPEDACMPLFPLPEDFIRELAAQERMRITFQEVDPDEDEDDWEEVMSELSDPWMRSPAPHEDELGVLPAAPSSTSTQSNSVAEVGLVGHGQDTQLDALMAAQQGLVVVDVRNPEEFAAGHIPGSVNMPIASITGTVAKTLAAQPVLVVASGDYRGSQACVRLTRVYGAQQVWFLEDGLQEWTAGGRQLEVKGADQKR